MSRGFRLTLLAAAGLMLAAPLFAQTTIKREPIKPIADVSGPATFNAYCTVCHGPAGKGDGPVAKALTKAPADLTQITKRHNGKFPANAIKMEIGGETTVAAHGNRDMPIWGPVFRSAEGTASELRLKNLVDYLESIQAK